MNKLLLLPLKSRSSADLLRFLRKGTALMRTYSCFYRSIEEKHREGFTSVIDAVAVVVVLLVLLVLALLVLVLPMLVLVLLVLVPILLRLC